MKKYVTPIIALALVLISLLFSATSSIGIKYGKGNGKDKEIKDLQDFTQFCEYVSGINDSEYSQTPEGQSLFSTALFSSDSQTTEITSFTYHEKNVASTRSSYNANGNSSSSNVKLTRQLDLYVTENITLYHSVGFANSNGKSTFEGETVSSGSYMDFDLWIYVSKDLVAIFIEKYDIHGFDDAPDFTPAYGKWLNAKGGESYFADINDNNMDVLGRLSNALKNEDNFKKSNKEWSIKEGKFSECLGSIIGESLPEDLDGDFLLDLSNSTAPSIDIQFDYTDEASGSGENYSYSASASSYNSINMLIENINNTMIEELNPEDLELLTDILEV